MTMGVLLSSVNLTKTSMLNTIWEYKGHRAASGHRQRHAKLDREKKVERY